MSVGRALYVVRGGTGDKLDNGMGEQTENVRSIECENNGREKPCELTDRSKLRERGQSGGPVADRDCFSD